MDWTAIVWLGLLVLFLLAEAACPIHLVSLWFAVGSLVALLVNLLGGPMWLQAGLFVLISGALLALLWPLTRKYLNPGVTKTNLDAIVGSTGLVTVAIDNLSATGQVKLGPMEWTARSTSGEVIPADTPVQVDRIEGVKVFVSPAKVSVIP